MTLVEGNQKRATVALARFALGTADDIEARADEIALTKAVDTGRPIRTYNKTKV